MGFGYGAGTARPGMPLLHGGNGSAFKVLGESAVRILGLDQLAIGFVAAGQKIGFPPLVAVRADKQTDAKTDEVGDNVSNWAWHGQAGDIAGPETGGQNHNAVKPQMLDERPDTAEEKARQDQPCLTATRVPEGCVKILNDFISLSLVWFP